MDAKAASLSPLPLLAWALLPRALFFGLLLVAGLPSCTPARGESSHTSPHASPWRAVSSNRRAAQGTRGVVVTPLRELEEFRVSGRRHGDQLSPALSATPQGEFVVTWTHLSVRQGQADHDVRLRRFSGAGSALGLESRVNAAARGDQLAPSVGSAGGGQAVVAWWTPAECSAGVDGRKTTAKAALSPAQLSLVPSFPGGRPAGPPVIAVAPSGGFVVAHALCEPCQLEADTDPDGAGCAIYFHRYDEAGQRLSGGGRVAVTQTVHHQSPAIAMAADGHFVIVWQSEDPGGESGRIQARRFDAEGRPLDAVIPVSRFLAGQRQNPAVTIAGDGRWLVTWSERLPNALADWEVRARRFGVDGAAFGPDFRVSRPGVGDQRQPAIAAADDGRFAIVWQGAGASISDGTGIYGRRYDRDGQALGSSFRLNLRARGDQGAPAIAMTRHGRFMVVWESHDPHSGAYHLRARTFDAFR